MLEALASLLVLVVWLPPAVRLVLDVAREASPAPATPPPGRIEALGTRSFEPELDPARPDRTRRNPGWDHGAWPAVDDAFDPTPVRGRARRRSAAPSWPQRGPRTGGTGRRAL